MPLYRVILPKALWVKATDVEERRRERMKGYYVSVRDEQSGRYGLLLGPYRDHEEALANVALGRDLANNVNAWAVFYAYGTCSIDNDTLPQGKLNDMAGPA